MLTFLILAGGSGERFWPLSTPEKPKQFLSVFSTKPLILETYERILPLVESPKQIFVSTNRLQIKALKNVLPDLPAENIIIEPTLRDTAAAIGYGTLVISKYFSNPTVVVLASDHLITEPDNFRKSLLIAINEAEKNKHILTLGMTPSYPETGYGYIRVASLEQNVPTKSLGFYEKPTLDLATQYVNSQKFLWNSGIFVFTYECILDAYKKYASEYLPLFAQISNLFSRNEGLKTSNVVSPIYEQFLKKSIDFAIMEKSDNIFVVPASFGWSDVGTFAAFDKLFDHDSAGDVVKEADVVAIDSNNNIVVGEGKLIPFVLLGINDCVIVNTNKGLLISKKDHIGDLKKAVSLVDK